MNRIIVLITFIFVLVVTTNSYAQVEKNYVVVEIGTGTWCGYCPGAAMAADDLVENGQQVAIIENHNGDSYANAASNGRNSFNGIPGYPTAYFNGEYQTVGGSATTSSYTTYLPKYNAAKSKMSDFTLAMSYTHTGLDYEVTIELNEVSDYSGTNLRVQLALTESHIAETWGGGGIMHELNFVNRAMYPNHNGTSYSGGTETIVLNFTANASWDLQNCELVAFVQDNTSKEILQVDKKSLEEASGVNNAAIAQVIPIANDCDGDISPALKIKNKGNASITSIELEYNINDGATTGTHSWSGDPIGLFDIVTVEIGEITFDLLAENTISFTITEVNGSTDDDETDNTETSTFTEAMTLEDEVLKIHIETDDNGDECTWNVINSAGVVVAEGGPYEDNTNINEEVSLDSGCYTFNIMDSGFDGIDLLAVYDNASTLLLLYTTGNIGAGVSAEFSSPGFIGVSDIETIRAKVFPNPANNELNIFNAQGLDLNLIDVLGRTVLSQKINTLEEVLNVSHLDQGTYILKLSNNQNTRKEKIILLK